jgi:serine/threonine protein phosphatase PrpC
MICPVCNTPNRDDAKFCKSCGRSLRGGPPPEEIEVTIPEAAPPAPPAPAGGEPAAEEASSAADPNDPSLMPTLILTQERMIEYQSRRWQRELERERARQGQQTSESAEETETPASVADLPTVLLAPSPTQEPAVQAASEQQQSDEQPQPSPGEEALAGTPPAQEETPDMAAPPVADQPAQAEGAAEQSGEPANEGQQETGEEPATAAGPLAAGTLLAGRYLVQQLVREEEHERLYQVVDQQGYRRCWNCGSEQNAEGDEFCIDCGAELLGVSYLLHEFTDEQAQPQDLTIGEQIIDTFVANGRTYAVEQPRSEPEPFPEGVHLVAAARSDAGVVRRDEPNEDSTLVLLLERCHESHAEPLGVFIVADGMGGHASGQLASRIAVTTIAERITRDLLLAPLSAERESQQPAPLPDQERLGQLLQEAVEEANNRLCQVNQQNKTDMGCTLTGFMVVGRHSYIVNVGDSRTYMVRRGQLYQLTTDHSLVGQLVAGGLIHPEDIYTHPQRSQIFRSLGDRPNVQIDLFKQELDAGDILLSCSDGLWEMVRDPQIERILNEASDPQTACTRLIEAANANGGDDNVSAVVVFVR